MRSSRIVIAAIIASLATLALMAATAGAALTHPYERTITETPVGKYEYGLCGLGIDPVHDEVYALNFGEDAVDVYDAEGNFIKRLSAADSPGTFSNEFGSGRHCSALESVGVNPATGRVGVNVGNRVNLFNKLGNFEGFLTGAGTPEKEFGYNYTHTTTDQTNGDILVSSYHYFQFPEGRIHRFDEHGNYLSEITGIDYPWEMSTDAQGNLYVSTFDNTGILKYNPAGERVGEITSTPYGPLAETTYATAGGSHVFVMDHFIKYFGGGSSGTVGAIREFDQNGNYIGDTLGLDTPAGNLDYTIAGIAASNSGRIFVAYNEDGGGKILVFGPAEVVPTVETEAATAVGHTSATLRGFVNPSSATLGATCRIEYGDDPSYGTSKPCSVANVPAGTANVPVSAELTGLATGHTYHYRVVATNANGTTEGPDRVVTPPFVLETTTKPATAIGRTSPTLQGSIDPDGTEAKYVFEYGLDQSYGETSPAPPGASAGSGSGSVDVSRSVTGLQAGTTYHYRISASNSGGTTSGGDLTFTTVAAIKGASTEPATAVERNSATLNATFDPDGEEVHYFFQYGTSTEYSDVAPAPPGAGAGPAPGQLVVSQAVSGLKPQTTYHFRVIAQNSVGTTVGADRTFTTPPAVLGVTTGGATEITPESATLSGSFDPNGESTHYYFQYGVEGGFANRAPVAPGADGGSGTGATPVSLAIDGLKPGTEYEYRLVAENASGATFGGAQSFTTAQVPTIEALSSSNLDETSADLNARINTDGETATYRFEYGVTSAYGSRAPEPDGTLAASAAGQSVSVHLEGLQPGVTYHFRIVAESKWGSNASEDQTFSFAPPSCPNALIRQQTGSNYLPDCRAYELVTPGIARGVTLGAAGPTSTMATSPSRLAFNGSLGSLEDAGDPSNVFFDLYVATRTESGWKSKFVGIPARESLVVGARIPERSPNTIPTSTRMDKFITWDNGAAYFCLPPGCTEYLGHNTPYVFNSLGEKLTRLPTNFDEVAHSEIFDEEHRGDQVASGDLNHFVFNWDFPAFAPDGQTEEPGSVYDNNIAERTVTVVSKLQSGLPIPREQPNNGGDGELLEIPKVSEDGSHILIGAPSGPPHTCNVFSECTPYFPVHLYMRADQITTYDVSDGHLVFYRGMTSDGSKVVFESKQQVTADDHDSSMDIFEWDEQTDSITRVSGDGEGGNSDGCTSTWTEACDAEVVQTAGSANEEVLGGCPCKLPGGNHDNSIARRSGELYFYSPEQLVGSKGLAGERNLYTFHDGAVQYVATLKATEPLTRIQVGPENVNAAFVTGSRLTAYDNDRKSTMYSYEPSSGTLICVSCLPSGAKPTVNITASQNGLFMTDDGKTFFSTSDAVVPKDTNELRDVYEFVEGRAQLITTGTAAHDDGLSGPAGFVGVTTDGTDAYFSTYDTIVAADQNGPQMKIYDARANGGIQFDPPAAPCVAADECHGPPSPAPALPPVLTEANLASGNHGKAKKRKKKAAAKKKKHAEKRRAKHKGGSR